MFSTLELLDTVKTYENEENPYVLQNLIENVLELSSILIHTDYFEEYKKDCLKLCKTISQKIEWEVKKNEGFYDRN